MKLSMIRVLQNLDTVVLDHLIQFHLSLILVTWNKEQVAYMCKALIGTFPEAASNRMLPNDDSKVTQFSKAHNQRNSFGKCHQSESAVIHKTGRRLENLRDPKT